MGAWVIQYQLKPKGLNEDKLPWKAQWFDEEELMVEKVKRFSLKPSVKPFGSGPCDAPPEREM